MKIDKPQFFLNRKDTAELFGVAVKTLDDWKLEKIRVGREAKYDIRKVLAYRLEKVASKEKLDYWEEQAQLAKIRRKKLELEVRVREGELIEKDLEEKINFEKGRIIRDHLLTIPDRVMGELAAKFGLPPGEGQEEVWQIINREIVEILHEVKTLHGHGRISHRPTVPQTPSEANSPGRCPHHSRTKPRLRGVEKPKPRASPPTLGE